MARITKTRRKKTARRAHEQRQPERRNDNKDGAQNGVQDVSQDESVQELYDDAEPAEDDSITGDGIPYILNLPNELLNAITTYAVYEKTPAAALRLVNKRFKDCSQTHLINNLQAKTWDLRNPHDIRSLNEISKFEALTGAIKSLRLTGCYEVYYDSEADFKRELFCRRVLEERKMTLCSQEVDINGASSHPTWEILTRTDEMVRVQMKEMEKYYTDMAHEPDHKWMEHSLDHTVRSRWEALRDEAEAMFGNIWTFSLTDHKLIGSQYDKVARYIFAKERFVTSLAATLGAFKNLHSIAYFEASVDGAKRYESLLERPRPIRKRHFFENRATYKALMIGLDLLLRALQRAKIRPRSFALPSPSLGFHRFATSVSPDVLYEVLKDTRTLRLIQVSERFMGSRLLNQRGEAYRTKTPIHHEEVELADKNFPSLRELTINLRFHMAPSDREPLKSDNVVKLNRLIIRYNPMNCASALPFLHDPEGLNHFGPHLKHLIISNAFHGNWNQFFRSIAKIHLQTLDIVMERTVYNEVRREIPGWSGLVCLQEHFKSAAMKCSIHPEWVRSLVMRVWKDQDDAVERLLEDSEQEGPFDWEEIDGGGSENVNGDNLMDVSSLSP